MREKVRVFNKLLSVVLVFMILLGITPFGDGASTIAYGASIGISSNYQANISVRVTMNNSPVQGIQVAAEYVRDGSGGNSVTDSNGDAVIPVMYFSQNAQFRFRVYASSRNLAYTGEVFDLFGGTPPADIELTPVPLYDVSTTVRIDGNPAANIPVNLQMGYGTPYTAVSGPDGCVIRSVPTGNRMGFGR